MIVRSKDYFYETDKSIFAGLKRYELYHVFEIRIDNFNIMYRVIVNDHEPGYATLKYYSSRCFTVETVYIPRNWIIKIYNDNEIAFAPGSWLESGFYEKFYDSSKDDEVYKIFERERDIIMKEEPLDGNVIK